MARKRSPSNPAFLVVGHLNKVHGMKGELFVWPLTDHPGSTFTPGVVFRLGTETGEPGEGDSANVTIAESRPYRRGFLVRFEGLTNRAHAEAIRGRYILRFATEVKDRAEGEFFYHELLGLQVETSAGVAVGEIVEVYEVKPVDLLEVRGPEKTLLIPFLKKDIQEIDLEGGRMVIDPPDGLLDL